MIKLLKIAITWNTNRLAKHSQEMKTFISSQNIDISLVSEIHFPNKSYCRISGHIVSHNAS
jgi:4-hydroxy-3-methylbut-2-en-1-yl diphosphate synthase IspG/GcpE